MADARRDPRAASRRARARRRSSATSTGRWPRSCDDPDAARVPAETRAGSRALAGRYRLVACVSGRRASIARAIVGIDELTYAGNHGLELLGPGEATPAPATRRSAIAGQRRRGSSRVSTGAAGGVRAAARGQGPDSGDPLARRPRRGCAEQRAREIADRAAEQGLVPRFGRMVLEMRPGAEIDKGVAARQLVASSGAHGALFGGDDRTDLDAFAALRELAATGCSSWRSASAWPRAEAPDEIERDADLVVSGRPASSSCCERSVSPVMLFCRPAAGHGAARRRRGDGARRGRSRRRQPRRRRASRSTVAGAWWLVAAAIGLYLGRPARAAPRRGPGARGCAHRDQPAAGEPRPDRVPAPLAGRRRSRSWSAVAGWVWPQVAAIGAGYAIADRARLARSRARRRGDRGPRRGSLLRRAVLGLRAGAS